MRVGVIAILQESNTFLAEPTTLAHFQQDVLAQGEQVRERFAASHHEVGGFFAGLAEQRIDAVPVFAARALPFGVITADAYAELMRMLWENLGRAGPLDGILVAPHGATVAASSPDADGQWLTDLRRAVGPAMPIIGTLDPHANLSQAMVDACDALIAYRTNPHLDQKQRGVEAARLMARTLRGEVRPTMAAAFPSLAVNIECQDTSAPPCKPMYDLADAMLKEPGVLSNSLILGFPYADVPEMGSSVIVVTDGDEELARREAGELAAAWWDRRREFLPKLLSPAEAVAKAASLAGPVCLLDMGDNVGGGSPGDSTILAAELLRQNVGPAFICVADPAAVKTAEHAGINAKIRLRVGNPSLELDVRVAGMFDGKFTEPEPRHGGITSFDQGPTAVLEAAGLTVMVTSRRMIPFSIRQLTTFHVEPSKFRVLVAKGVHAPVAAYAPVCKAMVRANTPGVTCADMLTLRYENRRRPLFPFEA